MPGHRDEGGVGEVGGGVSRAKLCGAWRPGSSGFIQSSMGNRWGVQSTEIVSFGLLKNSLWSR